MSDMTITPTPVMTCNTIGLTAKLPGLVAAFALFSCIQLPASALAQSGEAMESADLQTVYERALEFDADYKAAQYDLDAARELIPLARSPLRPQLALGAEGGVAAAARDGEGAFGETRISLSLSQAIYDRASSKSLDQAELNVRVAEAQYAVVRQTLILRVAAAYFDVLRAQVNVEFSQSELEAISRQREQAERRFDVGLVPITDVRSAQAQYDLAVAQEIDASNQLSTAREALRRISGIDTDQLSTLAADLPLLPPDPADITAWVDRALEQNLELVIAELNYQSRGLQMAIERASSYPTLNLVGSALKSDSDAAFGNDTEAAELKLQLSVPILTGGRINAQVAQARSQAQASEQQLLAQERTTTQQTRDAYRGVQASISRARALNQALVSTQQSAEAAEAGFRAGTRTSVEVLQALRDTFSARSNYAGARYDYIINTLNLKAATGTLSESDLSSINRFLMLPEES